MMVSDHQKECKCVTGLLERCRLVSQSSQLCSDIFFYVIGGRLADGSPIASNYRYMWVFMIYTYTLCDSTGWIELRALTHSV